MTADTTLRRVLEDTPQPTDEQRRRVREAVLAGEPGRSRTRRAMGRAVSVTGIAAAGGMLVLALPRGERPPVSGAGLPLAVLHTPQRATDRLPAWAARDRLIALNGIDLTGTRRVARVGNRDIFLAHGRASRVDDGLRATGSPTVCLLTPVSRPPGPGFRPGRPGRVDCMLGWVFARTGMVTLLRTTGPPDRPRATLVAVVPDGYDGLDVGGVGLPIRDNVAVRRLVLSEPALASATVHGPAGDRPLQAPVSPRLPHRPDVLRSALVEPRGPYTRPWEPLSVDLTLRIRRPYTSVTVGARTVRVGSDRTARFRGVAVSPSDPLRVTVTGPGTRARVTLGTGLELGRGGDDLSPRPPGPTR